MKPHILTFIIFFISITKAMGCSCTSEKEPLKKKVKKAFYKSDVVFTGNLVAITDLNTHPIGSSSADPVRYTFEVIKKIKGVTTRENIQIISARSSASCGYVFQIGKTYMVYASISDHYKTTTKNESDFITSSCRRNNHIARVSKKEKRILEKLSKKELYNN